MDTLERVATAALGTTAVVTGRSSLEVWVCPPAEADKLGNEAAAYDRRPWQFVI